MSGRSNNRRNRNIDKIASGIAEVLPLMPWVADTIPKIMEKQKRLVSVPELYSKEYPLSAEQAVELLNNYGLKSILVKTSIDDADIKYRKCFASQVISTKPKGKQKVDPGDVVFVKYITQEVIDASQKIFEELDTNKKEIVSQKQNKRLERKERTEQIIKNTQSKVQKVFRKNAENNSGQEE